MSAALLASACTEISEDKFEIGNTSPTLPEVTGDEKGIETDVFDKLNLDYPGLEKVKACVESGNAYGAAYELREYWKTRSNVSNPAIDLINPTITANQQKIADQALNHQFYINNTYVDDNGDYFNFGDPIDWEFLPDKFKNDQEFKYQIHRHNWMEPQALAYKVSGNEEYVTSWIDTYQSWVNKYPCPVGQSFPTDTEKDIDYQWKGLQTASRVLSQVNILSYVILSPNVTPAYLTWFLDEFEKAVEHIRINYYNDSNILVTQLQAVATAGILMPEFAAAEEWRNEGASKLGEQLDAQFLPDGVHYEFDPSYHIAAISDFRSVYELAKANNMTELFPESSIQKLEKAAEFVMDITFPDYSLDNFNDTRNSSYSKSVLLRNFRQYATLFPQNQGLIWMAREGNAGAAPDYTVKAYKDAGYYMLRSDWTKTGTMIVLKNNNNPENKWHCQPDNGTFAIWHNGRNFFPDAGVYSYNTDSNRSAYRRTRNHNTVTLNGATIDGSHQLGQFVESGDNWISTSNTPKDGVTFTRKMQLNADRTVVILDEIAGANAETPIENFHILTDDAAPAVFESAERTASLRTTFADGNNMYLITYAITGETIVAESVESDISNKLGAVSGKRLGFRLSSDKAEKQTARFITVIVPCKDSKPEVTFTVEGDDVKYSIK